MVLLLSKGTKQRVVGQAHDAKGLSLQRYIDFLSQKFNCFFNTYLISVATLKDSVDLFKTNYICPMKITY